MEKEEIAAIRLPSSDTLDLNTFFALDQIPIARFERPYFILSGKGAAEIYAVIQHALLESKEQVTDRSLCAGAKNYAP